MSNKRYSFGIIGFHHEGNYKWCFGYPKLMQDSPLGYWFSPRRQLYTGFGIRGWYKILLRAIGFHPEQTLYGASVIRILCKILLRPNGFHPENNYIWGIGYLSLMQDPPFGLLDLTPKRHSIWASANYVLCRILLWVIGLHPEAKHGYIWKWSYFGLMEFYLAFGYWCTWQGCTEASIPLRQAKRGVIGALQVNTTLRNEPRACEAERPTAPFGLNF